MTTTLANKETALGFFDAVLNGDSDRATSMLTDDCEFFFAGDLPVSGRYDATSGIGTWATIRAMADGSVTFDFGAVTAEDDRVAIEAESRGSSGERTFNNQYHFLFRFRDGKISQVKEYFDTLHVWAYPVGGGAPEFVGVAQPGGARPDVAVLYGPSFGNGGYTLSGRLAPGTYDLVVFAHSAASNSFAAAETVRVIAR